MKESRYHWNMELMASVSSELLVLSIQHVSIHAHSSPSLRACRQVNSILRNPSLAMIAWLKEKTPASGDWYGTRLPLWMFCMSWNVTSSSPQVCDKMAYLGIRSPKNSSMIYVFTLMRRMLGEDTCELGDN